MHDSAPRAPGRCITVNCAALPETRLEAALCGLAAGACTDARRPKRGLREEAAQGTRCLDESDTVPLPRQAKWRTVLEAKRARRLGAVADRAVDVTLSVATQTELSAAGSAGHFRLALLHRLAMVGRALPPWRERGAALLRLAPQCFLPAAASHGLVPQCRSPAAEAWRMDQDWPGNGRALRQLMERRTLLSPDAVREPPTLPQWCLPQPPPATRPPATLPPADRQP